MGTLSLHNRVPQAARLAETVATPWLAADSTSDARAWSVRASDLFVDFLETGAIADLQRACAAALCALAVELHRGCAVPQKELARVGEIVAAEAVEIIDAEIGRLDAAIAGESDRDAKKQLFARRAELRREQKRIRAALRGKSESIEEVKL